MFAGLDAASLMPTIKGTVLCGALVGMWAALRPTMVRDYDQRRLPPNPVARIMFTAVCLFTYIVLVIFVYAFKEWVAGFAKNVSSVMYFLEAAKVDEPLLALLILGGLFQLPLLGDLERSFLVWLHSGGHQHQDNEELSVHLAKCTFVPAETEDRKNRDLAKRFGVLIPNDFNGDNVGVVTFQSWRKVASLLRMIRQWNPDDSGTLSPEEMKLLGEFEDSHERKTQLAMTIVKLFERAERGDTSAKPLSDLMAQMATTRYTDAHRMETLEANVRSLLPAAQADASHPLQLTSQEFRTYLAQIEVYFQVEYEILLQQVADLAARSVVLSGDAAPDRLETLRKLGFGGLGRIEKIDFNRSLWIFLLVLVGGFLVMFLVTQQLPADQMARFAFVMACASLVGAYTVSRRALATSAHTPWGAFILAGLIAVGLHIGINVLFELPKLLDPQQSTYAVQSGADAPGTAQAAQGDTANSASQSAMVPLHRRLVWGWIPFFLVLAICRLGRLARWPMPATSNKMARDVGERMLDALTLSATMLMSFYLVIATHDALGWELPKRLQKLLDDNEHSLLRLISTAPPLTLMSIGFLIGFFVVRDVRRAAHARIIDPMAPAGSKELVLPAVAQVTAPA